MKDKRPVTISELNERAHRAAHEHAEPEHIKRELQHDETGFIRKYLDLAKKAFAKKGTDAAVDDAESNPPAA
jgi:hypothetical protein